MPLNQVYAHFVRTTLASIFHPLFSEAICLSASTLDRISSLSGRWLTLPALPTKVDNGGPYQSVSSSFWHLSLPPVPSSATSFSFGGVVGVFVFDLFQSVAFVLDLHLFKDVACSKPTLFRYMITHLGW